MPMKTNNLDPQIVEYFLKKVKRLEDIFGDSGVMKELKKALTERILEGELTYRARLRKTRCKWQEQGRAR